MGAPALKQGKRQKQKRKMSARLVEDEDYQLRHERVAGIDAGKGSVAVCVRLPPAEGRTRRTSRTWEVPSTVPDLEKLAGELTAAGVQKVSMESTSDYWRICFVILEEAGLEVQMVDSRQARNLPGRPKTDRDDAAWIARLTEMGLLRPSFVPPAEIRELRVHTRLVVNLTAGRTRHWQRIEKLLEDALCKLSSVASKMAGSVPVRAMLEAMAAGETDPRKLAGLAKGPLRRKLPELAAVFTGMRFGPQHAAALRSHLRAIDFLDGEITGAQAQARAQIAAIPAAWGIGADGTTGPDAGQGPDAVVLPAVARLAEIPGMSEETAIGLIAEIGLDMDQFPTPGHLVSRAGMAPVAAQSGNRKGKGKKGRGNSYARRLATAAGHGAAQTGTFPGERHRRIRQRPGGGGHKKASCAVGRSVLIIAWHLLKNPRARYRDLGPDHYARHAGTGRKVRGHIRQLEALGLDVTVTPRQETA